MEHKHLIVATPSWVTLENFARYLRGHQVKGHYPVNNDRTCAIAHFAQWATGQEVLVHKDESLASFDGQEWFEVPEVIVKLAVAKPHIYSALLERTEHALTAERIEAQLVEQAAVEEEAAK